MQRLDIILKEKGLYPTREKARQAIASSRVKVNGVTITKPATLCDESATFDTLPFEFVSRGGFKLQKAIEEFGIDLNGKTVLDIGASTGGFSDVALQNGAKKVYAIDTGENQLHEKIKTDKKVVDLSKHNYLDYKVESDVNFVVIDVSFTSLTKLAKKLGSDFKNIEIVALIKPQFECGPEYARKHKGIVKDTKMHEKIIKNIEFCFKNEGFSVCGLIESPIKGGSGNTEFLIYLKK